MSEHLRRNAGPLRGQSTKSGLLEALVQQALQCRYPKLTVVKIGMDRLHEDVPRVERNTPEFRAAAERPDLALRTSAADDAEDLAWFEVKSCASYHPDVWISDTSARHTKNWMQRHPTRSYTSDPRVWLAFVSQDAQRDGEVFALVDATWYLARAAPQLRGSPPAPTLGWSIPWRYLRGSQTRWMSLNDGSDVCMAGSAAARAGLWPLREPPENIDWDQWDSDAAAAAQPDSLSERWAEVPSLSQLKLAAKLAPYARPFSMAGASREIGWRLQAD
jgi:hypothetical protein